MALRADAAALPGHAHVDVELAPVDAAAVVVDLLYISIIHYI